MKISVHLDTSSPADAAALSKLLGATGIGTEVAGNTPAAPAAPAASVMPTPAAAPAAPAASVMPAPAAPAPTGGVVTREELIKAMAGAVKIIGPGPLITRVRNEVEGFTDVPNAPPEMFPAIAAVLEAVIAGK